MSRPGRALCFSAYVDNIRAVAIIDGLSDAGWTVAVSRGRGVRSTPWELAATLVPNCWMALRGRGDLAVGFKPHLNVTLPLLLCRARGMATWLDVDDLDHAYRSGLSSRIIEVLQRPFPRRCDVVTHHNPLLREHLVDDLGCDPDRVVRVPQGVDPRRFTARGAPATPAIGGPVAVYTARLNRASDLGSVLQAWKEVVRRRPEATLLVVGGGPLLRDFQRQAARLGLRGRVRFAGEVQPSEVPAYLALASVALTFASDRPVNRYRCSLKLREYFASGLPVVCNDVGELSDFAEVTYQTSSSLEDYSDMIVRVLDGHDDGRQDRAQAVAADEMSWHRILGAAIDAVVDVVGLTGLTPTVPPPAPREGAAPVAVGLRPPDRRVGVRPRTTPPSAGAPGPDLPAADVAGHDSPTGS